MSLKYAKPDPDFLPSIHYCKKVDLYCVVKNEKELEYLEDTTTYSSTTRNYLLNDFLEQWYETEEEALEDAIKSWGLDFG